MQHLGISILSSLNLALVMLPGLPLALLLRARPTFWTLITDALLSSLALDSAIFWLPPLQSIPLDVWCWFLASASIIGVVALLLWHKRVHWPTRESFHGRRLILMFATCVMFAFYVTIALVRPNVEWDAVNYYLATAVGFVVSGHVGYFLPHALTIADRAPMSLPPVMPTLYATAIGFAAPLHIAADQTVRWIPLALLFGAWAATRRLARMYLSAVHADCAGLLFLSLPALILYMTANPLNIDLALTFIVCTMLADFVSARDSVSDGLRVGLACSLALLTKVTGLPILGMSFLILVMFWLGGAAGRVLLALALGAATALAWKFGLVSLSASPMTWVAIAIAVLFAFWSIPSESERPPVKRWFAGALVVGFLPCVFSVIRESQLVGSPLGFYAPGLTHIVSPNWEWAWTAIRNLHVYDAITQPGLVQNAGLGLLLWWGFSPAMNLLASYGYIVSMGKHLPVRWLGTLVALFTLAWLTIFHSSGFHNAFQFREFLVLGFVEPILATVALRAVFLENVTAALLGVAVVEFLTVPFAWIAQETFFQTPHSLLDRFGLNQWLGMSNLTLRNVGVFSFAVCGVFVALWYLARQRRSEGSGLYPQLLIIAATLLMFAPVIVTGISPGFAKQYVAVRDSEVYGYLPALDAVIGGHDRSVLTFVGYGVTWYSLGQNRSVDLTDALALGLLKPALSVNDPSKTMDALRMVGATAAIFPIPGSDLGRGMTRLIYENDLNGLTIFDDPLLVRNFRMGNWSYFELDDSTTLVDTAPNGLFVQAQGGTLVNITEAFDRYGRAPLRAFVIRHDRVVAHSAVVTFEGNSCTVSQLCEHREFRLEFPLHQRNPIVIPLAEFARQMTLGHDRPADARMLLIRQIEVQFLNSRGKNTETVDWRSSHFVVYTPFGTTSLGVGSSPFVAYPELAPLAAIDVSLNRAHGSIRIYPLLASSPEETPPYATLRFTLRASPLCPLGAPLTVTASGTKRIRKGGTWQKAAWQARVVGQAGGVVGVSIPNDATDKSSAEEERELTIQGAVAHGVDPHCAVSEELAYGNAEFSSRHGGEWRPSNNVAPLAIRSLFVPMARDLQPVQGKAR